MARRTPTTTGRGREIEQRAYDFLCAQGLTPLARNYRCTRGEIDLILHDQDVLVFVEVRYRRSAAYGGALESVDRAKRARLQAAATHYLHEHRAAARHPCRFDVIAITGDVASAPIEWLQNAFDAQDV